MKNCEYNYLTNYATSYDNQIFLLLEVACDIDGRFWSGRWLEVEAIAWRFLTAFLTCISQKMVYKYLFLFLPQPKQNIFHLNYDFQPRGCLNHFLSFTSKSRNVFNGKIIGLKTKRVSG